MLKQLLNDVRELLQREVLEPTEISESLKIAVNSLLANEPNLLSLSDQDICVLLQKNEGVLEILQDSSAIQIAWAIHLATERRTRSSS